MVNGVPMTNFVGESNSDFGNRLSDLNSEDIDNVTVLKGGAASALYGSRAGNGVILITTKTGKNRKGIGITLSETVGLSELGITPAVQKVFGHGIDGLYPTFTGTPTGSSWDQRLKDKKLQTGMEH